jgi:hypothetical protein
MALLWLHRRTRIAGLTVRSITNGTEQAIRVVDGLVPSAGLYTNRENMARLSVEAAPSRLPEALAPPPRSRPPPKERPAFLIAFNAQLCRLGGLRGLSSLS